LEAVGEAIRERREELRMSQSALGDASALRQQEVSKIERGTIDLRARTLNRLAEALGRTAARIDDRALKLLGDRVRAAPGRETADSDTSDREHSLPLDGE
jgi:transcriptional regulator with XRE-family HTH domain